MAEIRTKLIVDLPIGQQLDGLEILPVQQDGVTKKITTQNIINFTKEQDYATWTNVASTHLLTNFITAQNVFLVRQRSDFGNPQLFIGSFENAPESFQYQITSLSGFRLFYHEENNAFVFTRQVSSLSSVQTLTAYHIDRFARTFIENLSTANTLSANKILITDNTANNALEIHQTGTGNALLIYDQNGDSTPFVVDSQGKVGIQTPNPNTELTISGNLSASSNLSATNVFVLNNIGVGTATRPVPEKVTVWGSISASDLFKDSQGNSKEWNSSYSTWRSLSGFHNEARSFVNVNSSTLIQTRTEVLSQSSNNRSGYATWNSLSGFHNEARSFVNTNSSTLIQARSEVLANSGNWAKYNYVNSGFLPLSGGTLYGNTLNISAKTFYSNDVIILGSLTATKFSVIQAQVLPITATRLDIDNELRIGKSLNVGTTGQIDGAFKVLGETTIDDIIVATNNIYTSGIFIDLKGNSNQWNSGYSTWNNLSGFHNSARTFVNTNSSNTVNVNTKVISTSSNWDRTYSTWSPISAITTGTTTFVSQTSSLTNRVNTYVSETSSVFILNGGNTGATTIGTNNNTNLTLETNNAARMTVTSSGRVGIGNNNPDNTLTVSGSAKAEAFIATHGKFVGAELNDYIEFIDSNDDIRFVTNSNEAFRIKGTGNVGIGTSSPTEKLQVQGNIKSTGGIYDSVGNSKEWNSSYSTWNSLSGYHQSARSFVNTNSSNIVNVNTYVQNTSSTFILNGGNTGAVTVGTNNNTNLTLETNGTAKVTVTGTGNVGINQTSPTSKLHVVDSSANPAVLITQGSSGDGLKITQTGTGNALLVEDQSSDTTPFIIKADGKVGIGTSTPTHSLQVNNAISFTGGDIPLLINYQEKTFIIATSAANWGTSIRLTNSDNIDAFRDSIHFYTSGTSRMYLRSDGNVGIGTTGPTQKLEVAGNIKSTGTFYDSVGDSIKWNSVYSSFRDLSSSYTSTRSVVSLNAGQTTINVEPHDTNKNTIDVYLNGVKLINGTDFTDSGTQIILTEPAVNSDYKLEYIIGGILPGSIGNYVSKNGDTMSGNLTVPRVITTNLTVPTIKLDRSNSSFEGGELQFARSSDNTSKYFIDVYGDGSDPSLRFFEKTGTSSFPIRFFIEGGTGNVGINTTTPNAKLQVQAGAIRASRTAELYTEIEHSNSYGGYIRNISYPSNRKPLYIDSLYDDNIAGELNVGGHTNIFIRGGTKTSPQTIATFQSDGNVVIHNNLGIGTSTPSAPLHVKGGVRLDTMSTFGTEGSIEFNRADNTSRPFYIKTYNSNDSNNGYGNYMGFDLHTGVVGESSRVLTLRGDGSVGIGTLNPGKTLTVVGDISATGKVFGNASDLDVGKPLRNKFYKFRERNSHNGSAVGDRAAWVITQDGSLNYSGYSTDGFGMGAGINYQTGGYLPTVIPLSAGERVEKFWVAHNTTFALTNVGNLWGTGKNTAGELGQGNVTNYEIWVPILTHVVDFSPAEGNVDGSHCLAVKSDGYIYGWGKNDQTTGKPLGLAGANILTPTLINLGSVSPNSLAAIGNRKIKKVYAFHSYQNAGYAFSFAIDTSNEVHVVGFNGRGHLGLNDVVKRDQWQRLINVFADEIYAGAYTTGNPTSTFIIRNGEVWSCGDNNVGQLGLGNLLAKYTFTKITTLGNNNISLTKCTNAGDLAVAVLKSDGRVFTWGKNDDGVLGHNATTSTSTPAEPTNCLDAYGNVYPKLPFITKIIGGNGVGGNMNFIALDINGDIWTSGENSNGQKGIGSTVDNSKFSKAIRDKRIKFVDVDDIPQDQAAATAIAAADENGDMYIVGHSEAAAAVGGLHYYDMNGNTTMEVYRRVRFV